VIALPIAYAVMLGVMCLAIAFGVTALSNVMTNAMRGIPYIGGWIADNLDNAMFSIVRSAIQWLLAQCWDAVQFVAAPFINLWHLMDGVITYVWGATFALTQAKHDYRHRVAQVTGKVTQVKSTLDSALNGVVTWTQDGFDTIYHDFEGALSNLQTWTANEITAVETEVKRDVGGVVTWTQDGFDTIYHNLEGAITNLARWTGTEINAVVASIDGAITKTDDYVGSVYDVLRTSIVQSQRQSEAYTGAAVAAAETGIYALLQTQVLPQVAALTTTVDECAVPYCAAKNTLGREATTLLGLVEDGVILAFLAAAIADPTGTAEATWTPLGAIIGAASALIGDLVKAA
jgi:hypothetical protein